MSYVSWFRKPAVAGSTVLLILFFGWLSTQIFLPSAASSDAMLLQNTFVQLFTQHGTMLDQSFLQVEPEPEKSTIAEFQWSVKRVIFAIKRENASNTEVSDSLRSVLQNAATFINIQK